MSKKDEIVELINSISKLHDDKVECIKNQDYVDAARLRDEEKGLLSKLDEVSGVNDFFNKVYNAEKILKHIDIITNSTEQLKKLRPNFREIFEDMTFDKYLVKLYKQRDEAYEAVLEIRSLIK